MPTINILSARGDDKSLLVDIRRSNNDVRDWKIEKVDDNTFTGYQDGDGKIYFYAKTNYKIGQVEMVKDDKHEVAVLRFIDSKGVEPLEVKAGFSFVSIEKCSNEFEGRNVEQKFCTSGRRSRCGLGSTPLQDSSCRWHGT